MGRAAARHRERGPAAPPAQAQLAFAFLARLPSTRPQGRSRAFRPHLRGRTLPGAVQQLLPLRSPPGPGRYRGVEAMWMEEALRGARAGEASQVERLLKLTRPEVLEVARATWNPRCGLEMEELQAVGEARLVELQAWQRFEPGRERGRTLWPAYARRLARQAMALALEREGPVHVTQWARRRKVALEELAQAQGRTLAEVVEASPEGGAAAALLGEPAAAPLEAAAHVPLEEHGGEELRLQALALVRLARLPVRERIAVAGPLGLLQEGRLSDVRLARHLRCSPAEVVDLRELGLERLREAMGA